MLQAAASSGGGGGSFLPLLMIILLFGVMYFMMIRPQQKRRREAEQMQRNLAIGDEVVTIGGLHGIVADIEDAVVVIEISPGVTARYSRPAIAKVIPAAVDEPEAYDEQPVADSIVEPEKKD